MKQFIKATLLTSKAVATINLDHLLTYQTNTTGSKLAFANLSNIIDVEETVVNIHRLIEESSL